MAAAMDAVRPRSTPAAHAASVTRLWLQWVDATAVKRSSECTTHTYRHAECGREPVSLGQ
jgi:hypothetical protein